MPLPANLVDAYPSSGADTPVLKFTQGSAGTAGVALADQGSPWTIPAAHTVTLLIAEAANKVTHTVLGTIVNAEEGLVTFALTAAQLSAAGLWLGEIVVRNAEGAPVKNFACYVEVTPTLAMASANAPLTIAEIRIAVRDRVPEDNALLNSLEFADAEILACIRKPVDWWNSMVPEGLPTYTCNNFPYRYPWLNAVIGELLRLVSHNLKRNQYALQGKGIAADDKARADFYVQRSEQLLQEWQLWAGAKMRQINVSGWYGRSANSWFGR